MRSAALTSEPAWSVASLHAISLVASLGGQLIGVGDRASRLTVLSREGLVWAAQASSPNVWLRNVSSVRSLVPLPASGRLVSVSGCDIMCFDRSSGAVLWHRLARSHWGLFPSRPINVVASSEEEIFVSFDDGHNESLSPFGERLKRSYSDATPRYAKVLGDGRTMVGTCGSDVSTWETGSASLLDRRIQRHRIVGFDGSSLANRWVTRTLEEISVWELGRDEARLRVPSPVGLPAVAIAPNGEEIAWARSDGVGIATVDGSERIMTLTGHGRISALTYSEAHCLHVGTSTGELTRVMTA